MQKDDLSPGNFMREESVTGFPMLPNVLVFYAFAITFTFSESTNNQKSGLVLQ